MPLLFLLLFLFFIPWIGFVLLIMVGVFLVLAIPMGFASSAFFQAFANPAKLVSLITNGKVKKNHALEHATVNVLQSRGYGAASGDVQEGGFSVRGVVDPDLVYDAAREALERLKAGQRELALSDRCTLTVVIANTVLSILLLTVVLLSGHISIYTVLLALIVALIAGPMASPFLQRNFTTDLNVEELRIAGVELRSTSTRYLGAYVRIPDQVFISTLSENGVIEAEVV